MTRRDDLKALAERGISASDSAREMGISRQRVYQLAREMGIEFRKERRTGGCEPRLVTGGIAVSRVNPSVAGKISELLVAADLMARGWQVFFPVYSNKGHDIVAIKNDKIITVEVRSGSKSKTGVISCFKRPEDHSDYYGIVVTGEPVHYEPALD